MDNINNLLIETLSGHGPVYPDYYGGDAGKYLTFNYPDEKGALYADHKTHRKIVYVQVHLYLDADEPYQKEKRDICRELKRAGFLWPEVAIIRDPDTGKRHIIFETQIKTKIKWEE